MKRRDTDKIKDRVKPTTEHRIRHYCSVPVHRFLRVHLFTDDFIPPQEFSKVHHCSKTVQIICSETVITPFQKKLAFKVSDTPILEYCRYSFKTTSESFYCIQTIEARIGLQ